MKIDADDGGGVGLSSISVAVSYVCRRCVSSGVLAAQLQEMAGDTAAAGRMVAATTRRRGRRGHRRHCDDDEDNDGDGYFSIAQVVPCMCALK